MLSLFSPVLCCFGFFFPWVRRREAKRNRASQSSSETQLLSMKHGLLLFQQSMPYITPLVDVRGFKVTWSGYQIQSCTHSWEPSCATGTPDLTNFFPHKQVAVCVRVPVWVPGACACVCVQFHNQCHVTKIKASGIIFSFALEAVVFQPAFLDCFQKDRGGWEGSQFVLFWFFLPREACAISSQYTRCIMVKFLMLDFRLYQH